LLADGDGLDWLTVMGWDDGRVANHPAPALTKREVAARE
jgi:hypothetical protein